MLRKGESEMKVWLEYQMMEMFKILDLLVSFLSEDGRMVAEISVMRHGRVGDASEEGGSKK